MSPRGCLTKVKIMVHKSNQLNATNMKVNKIKNKIKLNYIPYIATNPLRPVKRSFLSKHSQ